MSIERVTSPDDPRTAPYRNLKDRELARMGGLFLAEGEFVARRLFVSDFPIEAVLLADRRVEEIAPLVPAGVPVYAAPDEAIRRIIGFKFHSGVIACGRRKPSPTLEAALPRDRPRLTLVGCPEISNQENLGALIRIAAAFGADAMLLGERCCDPFFRQVVRVSMGTVFQLPLVRSQNMLVDLHRLKTEWGMQLAAAVLDADA